MRKKDSSADLRDRTVSTQHNSAVVSVPMSMVTSINLHKSSTKSLEVAVEVAASEGDKIRGQVKDGVEMGGPPPQSVCLDFLCSHSGFCTPNSSLWSNLTAFSIEAGIAFTSLHQLHHLGAHIISLQQTHRRPVE